VSGLPAHLDAGEIAVCKITARDACGNRLHVGGHHWELRLRPRGEESAVR
jgi:hypothetical protein